MSRSSNTAKTTKAPTPSRRTRASRDIPKSPAPSRRPRARRDIPESRAVLTLNECDVKFRLRSGTAGAAVKAGKIKATARGRAVLVSHKRARELWGVE